MAANKNYRQYYQDGSAARNLYTATPVPEEFFETEAAPVRVTRQQPVRQQKTESVVRTKSKRRVRFWICAGVATVMVICGIYLGSRGAIAERNTKINRLQAELTELTLQNEALEASINNEIDYDAIRDTAVNDYGMITPGDGQIRTYSTEDEGYVRQYKDL